jgi:hypothetical protein
MRLTRVMSREVESARPLPPTGHRACVFNVLQAVRRIFCAGQSGAAGAYTVAALPLHDSAVNAPPPINLLPRTSPQVMTLINEMR